MAPALPVLYSFRRCPYAMRARLALAVSATPYELREVVLREKPADMLAASPKGTVPVLVLPDSSVIDESLDVMRWALAQHDPEGWLSEDASVMADMLALIEQNDGAFKHHLDRYKYPHRYSHEAQGSALTDLSGFAAEHRRACSEWLGQLEVRLKPHGWLCGPRATLADMALRPFVRQFAHTDPAWFAAQNWPALQQWLAAFEASPLFAQIMEKHPAWRPGEAAHITGAISSA
ncbi:glutathione S-transferase [Polaromonas sp. YR568]|uniref:glutathione S-transferase n=1 Tax=Polaromonas sp. YR568 TaxID=1855301 RepID=UPI003137B259